MADGLIRVEVVTPARAVLDIKAKDVVLPGVMGELDIMPGHLALLTALGVGRMIVRGGPEGTRTFVIDGGVAEIADDTLTVLTESCEGADEIDIEHAKQMLERAEADLKDLEDRSKSEVVAEDAMELHRKQIERARARILHGKSSD
jgi:F-type H+-transporting ATPase subunit epsilon